MSISKSDVSTGGFGPLLEEIKAVCCSNWKGDEVRFVPKRNRKWIKETHPDLYTKIEHFPEEFTIKNIATLLRLGLTELPICPVCKQNKVKFHPSAKGIGEYCSNRCAIMSEETQQKTAKTCESKYGKRFNVKRKEKYELGEHHLHRGLINLDTTNDPVKMQELCDAGWSAVAKHFGLTTKSHASAHNFMRRFGYTISVGGGSSKPEKEILEFVRDLGFIAEKTKWIITPYELDVYIPARKLAIEFDGLYWHSAGCKEEEKPNKHLNKTQLCEEKGIHLLHIFENEWYDPTKQEIWKSVIKQKLGLNQKVYARKCVLKEITNKEANDFCDTNHLQGSTNCSFAKGLFYDNELVMVATFGKPRYNRNYEFELIRMCTKVHMCVVGGASKLTKDMKFITYANRRWSQGNVYSKLGMKFVRYTEPCYYYVYRQRFEIYHRSAYMKHKLASKLENYDPSLTESQNCYNNGLRRIWDCGNIVYECNG